MKILVCFSLSTSLLLWVFQIGISNSFLLLRRNPQRLLGLGQQPQLFLTNYHRSTQQQQRQQQQKLEQKWLQNGSLRIRNANIRLYNAAYSSKNAANQDNGVIIPEDGYGSPCVIKVSFFCISKNRHTLDVWI